MKTIIIAIVATMLLVSYMNTQDINACMERGHTFETCNHIFNR